MGNHNRPSSNNLINMVDLPKQITTLGCNQTVTIKSAHLSLSRTYASLAISSRTQRLKGQLKKARALIKQNCKETTTIGIVLTLLRSYRQLAITIEQHLLHSNNNRNNKCLMGSNLAASAVLRYSMQHRSTPIVQRQQLPFTRIELSHFSFTSSNRLFQQSETQLHHHNTNSFPAEQYLHIVKTSRTTTIILITIPLMKLR